MEITVKRIYFRDTYTIGAIQVNGKYLMDTLEPHAIPWKDNPFIGQKAGERIAGQTAVPEGCYRVELRFSKTYKRTMPVLAGVPEFKSIVIRAGKRAGQTRGDILVGRLGAVVDGHPSDNPHLEDSRKTFNLLFSMMEDAMEKGETVWVEVRSHKEWNYEL